MTQEIISMIQTGNQALINSDYLLATKLFNHVILVEPNNAIAHAGLAKALYHLRKIPEAKIATEHALKLDDTLTETRIYLAYIHLFLNDDLNTGYLLAESAYKSDPDSAMTNKCFGTLNFYTGQEDNGLRLLDKALQIRKDDKQIYELLIKGNLKLKRKELAYLTSQRYFKQSPNPKSFYLMIMCYIWSHKWLGLSLISLLLISLIAGFFYPIAHILSAILWIIPTIEETRRFLNQKSFWRGGTLIIVGSFLIFLIWLGLR